MKKRDRIIVLVGLGAILAPPPPLLAETVVLPEGTVVYARLEREVTSKKKDTAPGDRLAARVLKDVEVDGWVVVEEGAEITVVAGVARKAKILGLPGALRLDAVSVRAVDGSEVPVRGYLMASGEHRPEYLQMAALGALPTLFYRGGQAVIPAGVVMEARVTRPAELAVNRRVIRIRHRVLH